MIPKGFIVLEKSQRSETTGDFQALHFNAIVESESTGKAMPGFYADTQP